MGILDFLSQSGQSQSSSSGIKVAPETGLEQQATNGLSDNLSGLQGLVGAGANQQDVTNGAQGQRDLASLLQSYSTPQGLLQAQQGSVQGYTDLGNQLFGGVLRQQNVAAQRQAALSGRQGYDPILQNKLAQQRSDTVGQFAAQQSLNAPMQSAQFATQRSGILDQLSQQAFNNRQTALGYGSQLREQDRAYRINTGEKYNNTSQTSTPSLLNTIGGLAGIAGAAFGAGGMFGAGGSGAGAGAAAGGYGGQSFLGGSQMAGQLGGGQFAAPQASSYFSGANPFASGGGIYSSSPAAQQAALQPAAYPQNNFVMQSSQAPAPQTPGQWSW